MKIGYFVTNQYLPGESMPKKIAESVELVQAARQAGFDLICTGQHYLAAPYQMSTSLPLLARLAAEAGDMKLATSVIRTGRIHVMMGGKKVEIPLIKATRGRPKEIFKKTSQ